VFGEVLRDLGEVLYGGMETYTEYLEENPEGKKTLGKY